jgi:NADH dehydrogenase
MVDARLRAPDARGVFAAGDACCAIPERGTLMSCQHAVILGKYAGENAARDLLGMRLLEYSQPRYVTCLDLGCSGAVFSEGWERVPVLTGDRAKAIKTYINTRKIYPPTGNRDEVLAASQIG